MFRPDLDERWLLSDYTGMHCFPEIICKFILDNLREHKQL